MFVDHPQLDLIQQLIHIFGIPAIAGGLIWLGITYNRSTTQVKEIADDTKETKRMTMETLGGVANIQNNHLLHMNENMKGLADSQDRSLVVLQSIDKGIGVLVDRNRV